MAQSPLVISYLTIRRTVGILGLALPFVLAIGSAILNDTPVIQSSISAYYHSKMHGVFIGTIFAYAIFLFAYRGYDWVDNLLGNLGGFLAIIVCLFPTINPNVDKGSLSEIDKIVSHVHLTAAASFFLVLAIFSLTRFVKTHGAVTPRKRLRNRIYTTCGITMLAATIFLALYQVWLRNVAPPEWRLFYWGEAAALVAFGISWLVKGEAILKDKAES